MLKPLLVALAALLALPAHAHDGPRVIDPYARISASSGAVFLTIENHSDQEDRLLTVATDAAAQAELHSNAEDANGVMQMVPLPDGIAIPAKGSHALDRGGDHIMLLGLTRPLAQGDTISLTLTFARGEVITLDVPVDNARKPGPDHAGMDHGTMDHSGHTP